MLLNACGRTNGLAHFATTGSSKSSVWEVAGEARHQAAAQVLNHGHGTGQFYTRTLRDMSTAWMIPDAPTYSSVVAILIVSEWNWP